MLHLVGQLLIYTAHISLRCARGFAVLRVSGKLRLLVAFMILSS